MNKCTICGSDMKFIPAGVSRKTNKPYKAFNACPKGCKTTFKQYVPAQPQQSPDKFNAVMEKLDNIEAMLETINNKINNGTANK